MPVYRPSELRSLSVKPKRALSQNFLIDGNILNKIVHAADIQPGDFVLEIGPGPGALTEKLLEKGAKVIAVEKDRELAAKLERLKEKGDLQIICDDVLNLSLDSLPKERYKLVANLPYHITSLILQKFVPRADCFSSLIVMVQKEFGQRMSAKTNSPEYSSFTIFLEAYSKVKYCFTVKPNSFFPPPSVHSCVMRLDLHPFPYPFPEDRFFTFTRRAFNQRRKMLRSSLKEYGIEEPITKMGLSSTARPQELSLEQFATLFLMLERLGPLGLSKE